MGRGWGRDWGGGRGGQCHEHTTLRRPCRYRRGGCGGGPRRGQGRRHPGRCGRYNSHRRLRRPLRGARSVLYSHLRSRRCGPSVSQRRLGWRLRDAGPVLYSHHPSRTGLPHPADQGAPHLGRPRRGLFRARAALRRLPVHLPIAPLLFDRPGSPHPVASRPPHWLCFRFALFLLTPPPAPFRMVHHHSYARPNPGPPLQRRHVPHLLQHAARATRAHADCRNAGRGRHRNQRSGDPFP